MRFHNQYSLGGISYRSNFLKKKNALRRSPSDFVEAESNSLAPVPKTVGNKHIVDEQQSEWWLTLGASRRGVGKSPHGDQRISFPFAPRRVHRKNSGDFEPKKQD